MMSEAKAEAVMEKAISALNTAFTERYHSVAQYVVKAGAYVRPEDELLWVRVRELAGFDAAEARRLADVIEELGGIPEVVPIASEVTELNYLSLEFLVKMLRETLARQIARYEVLARELDAVVQARNALQSLCRGLKERLDRLAE